MRFPAWSATRRRSSPRTSSSSSSGKDTELDRTVVEALGDPLVHLIRNSLDHGLEPPDARRAGKPKTARSRSRPATPRQRRHRGARRRPRHRPAKVGKRAVERGLITRRGRRRARQPRRRGAALQRASPTAEVTDISGRGVGMDAVRTMIRELGGEVTLTSEVGHGTVAQIRLPLTLAIMSALLVEAGGEPYAIPLDRVERTLRLADQTVRSVAGQRCSSSGTASPLIDGAKPRRAPRRGPTTPSSSAARPSPALAVTGWGPRELSPARCRGCRRLPPPSRRAVLSDGRIARSSTATRSTSAPLGARIAACTASERTRHHDPLHLSSTPAWLANIAPAPPAPPLADARRARSTSPCPTRSCCRSPRPSRPSARPSRRSPAWRSAARRHGRDRAPRLPCRTALRCAGCSASRPAPRTRSRPRRDRQHPQRLLHHSLRR